MPTAVYVHFPWCLQKCPYCDFASEAVMPARLPHRRYADAVAAEVELRRDDFAPAAPGGTVFFGGGTPSLWEPDALSVALGAIRRAHGDADEVTVECNPTSLTTSRAEALREIGVTRLSIGVQSLRPTHLRYLGRMHSGDEALEAVRAACAVPGLRVSADLMFGMPEQRVDELLGDAEALLAAGVEHLSVYALTIESNTRFGELARKGRLPRLADEQVATLYEALEQSLRERGMRHYEVSNYAAVAAEARARHNLAYWRCEPYVGLGAGAVGCAHAAPGADATRYRNGADADAYMLSCERGRRPPGESESLTPDTVVREGLMLGLRTDEGVDLADLAARTGVDPRRGRERAIAQQIARGNLVDTGTHLRVPASRWLIADDVVSRLF